MASVKVQRFDGTTETWDDEAPEFVVRLLTALVQTVWAFHHTGDNEPFTVARKDTVIRIFPADVQSISWDLR